MSSTPEKSLATFIQEMESPKDDIFFKIIHSRKSAYTHQDQFSLREPGNKLPLITESIGFSSVLFLKSSSGARFFTHILPRSLIFLKGKEFVENEQGLGHTVEGIIFNGPHSYSDYQDFFDGLKMVTVLLKADSPVAESRYMDLAVDSESDLIIWRYGRDGVVWQSAISEIMSRTDRLQDDFFGSRLELVGNVAFVEPRPEQALAFSSGGAGSAGGGEGAAAPGDHPA
jgi:hypothetical protein